MRANDQRADYRAVTWYYYTDRESRLTKEHRVKATKDAITAETLKIHAIETVIRKN